VWKRDYEDRGERRVDFQDDQLCLGVLTFKMTTRDLFEGTAHTSIANCQLITLVSLPRPSALLHGYHKPSVNVRLAASGASSWRGSEESDLSGPVEHSGESEAGISNSRKLEPRPPSRWHTPVALTVRRRARAAHTNATTNGDRLGKRWASVFSFSGHRLTNVIPHIIHHLHQETPEVRRHASHKGEDAHAGSSFAGSS
jgi:hypothetical protein